MVKIAYLMPMGTDPESEYPPIVRAYRRRYDRMATPEYREELRVYTETALHDSIRGLDWKELLDWEHRHLQYTKGKLPNPRAEMPIEIIGQSEGRCGEFGLLYNGLLLANSYQARIVVDCSTLQDKSRMVAGDHVWNEILVNEAWTHVDPTEKRVNCPLMYALEWNKDLNLVYAIGLKQILNVTKSYSVHISVPSQNAPRP